MSAPAGAAEAAPAPARRSTVLGSLGSRGFRLYWIGQSVSNVGSWMQSVAQDWVVLQLTHSAGAVGLTLGFQYLPQLLLSLWGGVIADRLARRRLVLATQTALAVMALALGLLALAGAVRVWEVWLLAFGWGVANSLDAPARQSFIAELVDESALPNAMALNQTSFQLGRVVGPAAAGVLIVSVGAGWMFVLNALSFLAVIGALLAMRPADLRPQPAKPKERPRLREALAHAVATPELLWPMVMVFAVCTFGYNFAVFLAAFLAHVFQHQGAAALGWWNTMLAVGSVSGALLAARAKAGNLRLTAAAGACFALMLGLVALAPTPWVLAVLLVPVGVSAVMFSVSASAGVQARVRPEMRGRITGLYLLLSVGGTPVGGPLAGLLDDVVGPRVTLLAVGALCLAVVVLAAVALRRAGLLGRADSSGEERADG